MKVNIGKYPRNWYSSNLGGKYMNKKHGLVNWVKRSEYTPFEKFLFKVDSAIQPILNVTINKLIENRDRKVSIKIDDQDLWSMDYTLALIILPMLKRLKETKHGSPFVDFADVPENLRPKEDPSDENNYLDATIHDRWNYVIDEIIWSFEQIVDQDSDLKFYNEETNKMDHDARRAWQERKTKGLILFGKYYEAFWD